MIDLKTKEDYDPYRFSEKELIEPFKTLDKGFDWLLNLARNILKMLLPFYFVGFVPHSLMPIVSKQPN